MILKHYRARFRVSAEKTSREIAIDFVMVDAGENLSRAIAAIKRYAKNHKDIKAEDVQVINIHFVQDLMSLEP